MLPIRWVVIGWCSCLALLGPAMIGPLLSNLTMGHAWIGKCSIVHSQLLAQTADAQPIEAMRVFVPEEYVDQVVTKAFLTVNIEVLDKLLKEHAQRQSLSKAAKVGIERATYVARWNEQELSSRTSLLQVVKSDKASTLNIGRISVALEDPQGAPAQAVSLARQLGYLSDNRLQISVDKQQSDYWFGFKAQPRRRDLSQQIVDLQLPPAVVGMMLIAAPAHIVVTSDVPCMAVADIKKFLPEQWPASAIPALAADEQWYAVWLSGQENCSLSFSPLAKVKDAGYSMLIASAQSDSQVTPGGIQVTAQFRLSSAPPSGKLRLQIEDPLHVRSLTVDGTEVANWKTVVDEPPTGPTVSDRKRYRVIEFDYGTTTEGLSVVSLDCIGRMPLPFDGQLPRIEVEGAYVLDGRCTLRGRERIQIEDVRSTAHVLATNSQADVAQWQWQWTGKAPTTSARMRMTPNQWTVRSLTRLDVQADAIVASVHANVASTHVQGNQTTMKLAPGWFVDSVELENAPIGVVASVNAAGDAPELNIRWDERRSDFDVRVILKAHYHQSTEAESLRLNSTRILSLPGSDQQDAYVIESSGRYRLELDAELLRMRAREDELLPWQQALLPRLSDPWIFRSGHAALPSIRLTRTRATLEARLHTTLIEEIAQVIARYDVICKPISGNIKQLKIQMTLPANAVAPTWTVVDSFGSSASKKISATSTAISSSAGETTFTIDLSEDIAEEFQLQSELVLGRRDLTKEDGSTDFSIPLPRMRQAVAQEAVLVVPATYKLSDAFTGIEILPPGICCDGGQLVGASPVDVVAVRYDANAFARVELKPQPVVRRSGWAHSEQHDHWQYSAGRVYHRSTWDIASPTAQYLELKIPANWEFQSMLVNGVEQSLHTNKLFYPDQPQLLANIPKGNHVRLQLICSHSDVSPWYQPVVYSQPAVALPVLRSQVSIWFPKHRWAAAGWQRFEANWADRFCPQRWWRLLSWQPVPTFSTSNDGQATNTNADIFPEFELQNQPFVTGANWWSLSFQNSDEEPRVWSFNQSWIGTICWCVFLTMCLAVSLICGAHWERWVLAWMVSGLALAMTPGLWLLAAQLLALAVSAATVVRLARATTWQSRAATTRRVDSLVTKSVLPKSGVLSAWLTIMVIGSQPAMAQPFKEGLKPKREVFGILIPVNRQDEVSGEFAYISPRLYGLLRNTIESNNQPSEVRVASAIYSLAITNDLVGLTNTLGDIQVELNVQASMPDAELKLSYLRSEVTLVRASLDSQSLILGDRIRQDSEQVSWRASDAESHLLRLTLRPRTVTQREGRGYLSISVPAIPMARLELQSESISDWRDIVVESIGSVQSESFRTLSARLGPVNRLNVNWPLSMNRNGPNQVQSDTWIHTRGDKIMAMCQLRMRGASGLQGALAIVGDANWIPVGETWEDFRFLSNEGTSASGRPIYTVEKLKERTGDEVTLKVLMLPRDESASSISIPFLALQQPQSSAPRTLAMSHTDSPLWKMVGMDWPALLSSQAAQLWNGTRLGEQPSVWRVPSGSVQNTLQRISPSARPAVSEVTEIQLQMPESKIKYVARWSSPLVGLPAVRFQIPNGLRVDSVMVDALPARYSIHKAADSTSVSELVVFVDSSLNGNQSLHLLFSFPTRLSRAFRLSRPVLLNSAIESSIVQIYQGVELSSAHSIRDESGIEFESLVVRDELSLQQLHLPIGRLDLGDRWRDKPELPVEFTLVRASPTRSGRALLRFFRNDQGWRARLDAVVDVKPGEANHVFFEVPRSLEGSLKEPLDSNCAMMLWPSPDSNRTLLAVLPERDAGAQAHITFTFKLPVAGASQSINIPDIRMPGLAAQRPALALPTTLADEPVRWSGLGRSLPGEWLKPFTNVELDLSAFTLLEPVDSQSQATWEVQDQREMDIEILLTTIALGGPAKTESAQSQSATVPRRISGSIAYWIEPHNHAHLDIDIPASCTLVGMEANDEPTKWQKTSEHQVRVMLQPSYLPTRLSLLVRWDELDATDPNAHAIQLPQLNAVAPGPVLVRRQTLKDGGDAQPIRGFTAIGSEVTSAIQAQVWADTLTRAGPIAAGRGGEELAVWLPTWNPMWLGLDSSSPVKQRRQAISSRTNAIEGAANEDMQLSVVEFWTEFLKQHQSINTSSWPLVQAQSIADFEWLQPIQPGERQVERLIIDATPTQTSSDVYGRYAVACGWLFLGLVIWRASRSAWQRYCAVCMDMVWPMWLALGIVTAALLPVWWPTCMVVLGLLIVLLRRYRQLQGDRHFVLKPKSLLYQK